MAKIKENIAVKELDFDADGVFVQDGRDVGNNVVYSTGSLGLDILTGGFSPGVIQLWGPSSHGKTFMALTLASEFQKANNYERVRIIFWATEGRYNPRLVAMVPTLKMESPTEKGEDGKLVSLFKIARPKNGEKMYDIILSSLKQDSVKYFHIIDSNEGITSVADEGKTMSEAQKTASRATLNTNFLAQGSSYMNHYGHVVLYTNQVRDKIAQGQKVSGVGKHHGGGHALVHNSNLCLGFAPLWTDLYIYENPNDTKSKVIGHLMKMIIEKTGNSGNARDSAEVPLIYDHGIDRDREIATLADAFGLIEKKGAWYALDGANIAQGQNKLIQFLKDNKDVAMRLENDIKKMAGLTI